MCVVGLNSPLLDIDLLSKEFLVYYDIHTYGTGLQVGIVSFFSLFALDLVSYNIRGTNNGDETSYSYLFVLMHICFSEIIYI